MSDETELLPLELPLHEAISVYWERLKTFGKVVGVGAVICLSITLFVSTGRSRARPSIAHTLVAGIVFLGIADFILTGSLAILLPVLGSRRQRPRIIELPVEKQKEIEYKNVDSSGELLEVMERSGKYAHLLLDLISDFIVLGIIGILCVGIEALVERSQASGFELIIFRLIQVIFGVATIGPFIMLSILRFRSLGLRERIRD